VQQRKRKKKKVTAATLPSPSISFAAKKEEDFSSLLQTKRTKKTKKNVSILPFRGHVGLVPTPAAPAPAPQPLEVFGALAME
jgi:hypothetical protein